MKPERLSPERLNLVRVYLAGPDVFRSDAADWAARQAAICARHGLCGVSPLDALADEPADWAALPAWRAIALRNEAHIRSCVALIANLTPFRGSGADAGTVYEIGYMRALGRPVFGYSLSAGDLLARTACTPDASGGWRDAAGLAVEDFGQFENLMIAAALTAPPVLADEPPLRVFERCVAQSAAILAG